MDERRAVRETREAAERELQMCVRAALTIQAFWRSFKVRKAIKAKKKRGTGGGRVAAAGGSQKKGKR
jgi:IQ domain-containing protein D